MSLNTTLITSVTGPASVGPGQALTAQVAVCNQGTRAESTRVTLLLSKDESIRAPSPSAPSEDVVVGDPPVPSVLPGQCVTVTLSGQPYGSPPRWPGDWEVLQPGWCQTLSVTGNAYPPPANPDMPGLYYVGAMVNPMGDPERFTDNNILLGGWIYIAP